MNSLFTHNQHWVSRLACVLVMLLTLSSLKGQTGTLPVMHIETQNL